MNDNDEGVLATSQEILSMMRTPGWSYLETRLYHIMNSHMQKALEETEEGKSIRVKVKTYQEVFNIFKAFKTEAESVIAEKEKEDAEKEEAKA